MMVGLVPATRPLAVTPAVGLYAAHVNQVDDILAQKRTLRAQATARRGALEARVRAAAAAALARTGLAFLAPRPRATIVSAFAPLPDELRLWPLLRRLARERYQLAMPVMRGKGDALMFRAWKPGDAMDRRVWGIAEPRADHPELDPDILLVPLLAFDARGFRLGYGGGYYDRTLRALRAKKPIVAVGVAYDQQAVDVVPHLDYDERLDWVLVPSGPRKCADR
jgi:5-formyltetrahydrofolate cyclo-ligase